MSKGMTASEMGKKGGKSTSERKRKAARKSLMIARKLRWAAKQLRSKEVA